MSLCFSSADDRQVHRHWLRRWLVRVLLLGGGAILIAEVALRCGFEDRLRLAVQPDIYVAAEQFGYRYAAGATAKLCVPGVCRDVAINSAGLVGQHHDRQRHAGRYRIALVADCEATGIWMNAGLSYADHLERMFNEDGIDAEVYNFSVDGRYLDYQRAMVAKEIVPGYSPDLVILQISFLPFVKANLRRENYRGYLLSWNADEPLALERARSEVDYIESHELLLGLYARSYTVRALARRFMNTSDDWRARYVKAYSQRRWAERTLFTPVSTKQSLEIVEQVQRSLQANGAELVVFGLVHPKAVALGVRYVEVPSALNFEERYTNGVDGHLNELGQLAFAARLYESLRAVGLHAMRGGAAAVE